MDSKRHTDSGFALGEAITDAYNLTITERAVFRLVDEAGTHIEFSEENVVAFREAGIVLATKIAELHQYVGEV